MTDISARLRTLAHDVAAQEAAGPGLPVEAVTSRARRRRTRRTAWSAGAAAVVVAALAVGGATLGRSVRTPVPAGTPTVSPTPSPSPTAPAVVLPVGVPGAPFGTCGSLVGAAPAHPVEPALFVEVGDVPRTLAAGEPLPYTVSLGANADATLVRPVAGPRVVVTRDDVVVAVTDAYGGARTDWTSQSGWTNVSRQVGDAPMTVCDAPGATTGSPLPAGEYAVWFVGEGALTQDELVVDVPAPDPALLGTLLHGPLPLTIEGTASAPTVPAEGPLDPRAPQVPVALGAPPPAPTTTGPWRLTHASGPIDMAAADLAPRGEEDVPDASGDRPRLDVPATLTHVGPGRSTLHADVVVHHWLVQDGRVVATTYTPTDRYAARVDLGAGHGTGLLAAPEPLSLCGPEGWGPPCQGSGDSVPPGEYTLLPGVVVHGGTLWQATSGVERLPDVLGADGPYVVLGAPVPLTLR